MAQREQLMTPGYRSSATCPSYRRPPSSCRRTNPQAGSNRAHLDMENGWKRYNVHAEFVRMWMRCLQNCRWVCMRSTNISMIYFSFSVFEPSLATKKHAHLSYYYMSLNGTLTHLTVNSICKILDLQSQPMAMQIDSMNSRFSRGILGNFLRDPESSYAAYLFANLWNYFIAVTLGLRFLFCVTRPFWKPTVTQGRANCAEDGVALVVADHQITPSEWSRCGYFGNGSSDCDAQDGRTVAIHGRYSNPNKRQKSDVRLPRPKQWHTISDFSILFGGLLLVCAKIFSSLRFRWVHKQSDTKVI